MEFPKCLQNIIDEYLFYNPYIQVGECNDEFIDDDNDYDSGEDDNIVEYKINKDFINETKAKISSDEKEWDIEDVSIICIDYEKNSFILFNKKLNEYRRIDIPSTYKKVEMIFDHDDCFKVAFFNCDFLSVNKYTGKILEIHPSTYYYSDKSGLTYCIINTGYIVYDIYMEMVGEYFFNRNKNYETFLEDYTINISKNKNIRIAIECDDGYEYIYMIKR